MQFVRPDAPKFVLVIVGSFVLIRRLHAITSKISSLQTRRLPPGIRARQVRTLASVITSVGAFVITFVAALTLLPLLGLNLGPVLASAGLAIGFGAQSLVHDFINGFYIILLENQYDIGDTVRIAGVKGAVRDDDGTVHTVPDSEIKIVSTSRATGRCSRYVSQPPTANRPSESWLC